MDSKAISIDYIDLILRLLAYCGVVLGIGGGIAWLRGERRVAPTVLVIGAFCLLPLLGVEMWSAAQRGSPAHDWLVVIGWLGMSVAFVFISRVQAGKERVRSLLVALCGVLLAASFLIPDERWSWYGWIAMSTTLFGSLIWLQVSINREKKLTQTSL